MIPDSGRDATRKMLGTFGPPGVMAHGWVTQNVWPSAVSAERKPETFDLLGFTHTHTHTHTSAIGSGTKGGFHSVVRTGADDVGIDGERELQVFSFAKRAPIFQGCIAPFAVVGFRLVTVRVRCVLRSAFERTGSCHRPVCSSERRGHWL